MTASRNDVHDALRTLLQHKDAPALNYAINYARAGLEMLDRYALSTQCVYVLNNMSHRRHPDALRIRQTLKEYVAEWQ